MLLCAFVLAPNLWRFDYPRIKHRRREIECFCPVEHMMLAVGMPGGHDAGRGQADLIFAGHMLHFG